MQECLALLLLIVMAYISDKTQCLFNRNISLKSRIKASFIDRTTLSQDYSFSMGNFKKRKSCLRSTILILNIYVYLLLAIVYNIVIPGYKNITLHVFFLVLFGIYKCFPVYGVFWYLYGPSKIYFCISNI